MSREDLILRIHAKNGRFRVTVSPDVSIREFYKIVQRECQAEDDHMIIYFDPDYTKPIELSSEKKLKSLHLHNGDILHALTSSDKWSFESGGSPDESESSRLQNTDTPNVPKALSAANKQDASDLPSPEMDTLKPKFMSFDAYLEDQKFETVGLPLLVDYSPKEISIGRINTLPPTVTLKHQPYRHVDHVEFMNIEEMNRFVSYWRDDLEMVTQRAGWLIGHYVDDPNYTQGIRAVIEAIYEPPQISVDGSTVELLDDDFFDTVKELSQALNLTVVGYILTHLPREELLTAAEVVTIAKFQLQSLKTSPKHYTGYPVSPFVTVTISMSSETQSVVTNAFMVSDLGMAFVRDRLLEEHQTSPNRIKLREPRQHEVFPKILQTSQAVTSFDPDWLLVRLNDSAPMKATSIFQCCTFPVENRAVLPQLSDVAMQLCSFPSPIPITPFCDFHFILYLSRIFDVDTAKSICEAVVSNHPVDPSLAETLRSLTV